MTNTSPIQIGLLQYSAYLASEAAFFVGTYREFISARLDGEDYPIPEFTLACVRAEAERATTAFRLSQIALLGTIHDPQVRIALARSCEVTQGGEQRIFDILTHFHLKCLEETDAETVAGKETDKLHVRWR